MNIKHKLIIYFSLPMDVGATKVIAKSCLGLWLGWGARRGCSSKISISRSNFLWNSSTQRRPHIHHSYVHFIHFIWLYVCLFFRPSLSVSVIWKTYGPVTSGHIPSSSVFRISMFSLKRNHLKYISFNLAVFLLLPASFAPPPSLPCPVTTKTYKKKQFWQFPKFD